MIKKFSPKVKCHFCEQKREPTYKEYQELAEFLSSRAKIVHRSKTGLCAKHQRKLAVAIKRARHLGLLPFKINL